MEKNTRRGFLANVGLSALVARMLKSGNDSPNLEEGVRNELVGIGLPSEYPDDPNYRMLGQYLDEHYNGTFVDRKSVV